MCTKSVRTSIRLRTVQAFIALSRGPGSAPPDVIPIFRIGRNEIRMFNALSSMWIELFDHATKMAIDSCGARGIGDVVAGVEALIQEATNLSEKHEQDASRTRG